MENLTRSAVALVQSQDDLNEHLPSHLLWDELLVFAAVLYELGHITLLTEFLNYVDLLCLSINDPVVVPDDVRVPQLSEDVHLTNELLLLLLRHTTVL